MLLLDLDQRRVQAPLSLLFLFLQFVGSFSLSCRLLHALLVHFPFQPCTIKGKKKHDTNDAIWTVQTGRRWFPFGLFNMSTC